MRCALALLLCWIAIPAGAAAQNADAIARARPHFEAGQQYYEEEQFAFALREFRRAHELTSQPEILYNIALCYERLGDFPNAVSTLERYLATEQQVAERAGAEERLARLRRTIEQRQELDETPEQPIEPQPLQEQEEVQPRQEPSDPIPVIPIAVFSVAGAALIAGVILGSVAIVEHDALLADCGGAGCSDEQVAGLNALTIATDVSFGVSLAAAAVALVLLLVLPEENAAPSGVAWRFE